MKNYLRYFLQISSVLLGMLIVVYFSLAFYIAQQAEKDTKTKADALLVLGARSYIDGKYNPCLTARIKHASELYKSGYAHKIIVSGGNDREDNINEADTMKKILIEYGIPATAILEERSATSTLENFTLADSLVKGNKLQSVIVVTEPFHVARAELVAKNLGYRFSISPTRNSPCWVPNHYLTKYFLKEPVAIVMYKIENKL